MLYDPLLCHAIIYDVCYMTHLYSVSLAGTNVFVNKCVISRALKGFARLLFYLRCLCVCVCVCWEREGGGHPIWGKTHVLYTIKLNS